MDLEQCQYCCKHHKRQRSSSSTVAGYRAAASVCQRLQRTIDQSIGQLINKLIN